MNNNIVTMKQENHHHGTIKTEIPRHFLESGIFIQITIQQELEKLDYTVED